MTDILLVDYDISFVDGDFATGESLLQEAELILITAPGQWKQFPAIGVDLENFILSEANFNDIKRSMKQHCKYDGKKVKSFSISNGIINMDIE